MVESSGPEADQAGPLPLDHPFVMAVGRLDLESIAEMLTAEAACTDRPAERWTTVESGLALRFCDAVGEERCLRQ